MLTFSFRLKKKKQIGRGEAGRAEKDTENVYVCVCEIHISMHWSLVHCSKFIHFPPLHSNYILVNSSQIKLPHWKHLNQNKEQFLLLGNVRSTVSKGVTMVRFILKTRKLS